jgi:hypothetical protein
MLNDERPFEVVRMWDLAIDVWSCPGCKAGDDSVPHGESCVWEYVNKRDASKLVYLPTARPMVFHVRRLRDDIAARLEDIPGPAERAVAAFAHAVVKVVNGVDRDGQAFADATWTPKHVRDERSRLAVMTEDEQRLFDLSTKIEIGAVAFRRSFFVPKSTLLYRLPRTSADAWGDLASLRAAEKQSRETRASSDTSSETAPLAES